MRYVQRVSSALAACVAVCGFVACSNPPRSEAERAADADIAVEVKAALNADRNLYAAHIGVDVEHGVVHLEGIVWSDEAAERAQRDAASVPGVTTVKSDLEVTPGGISESTRRAP
ncbi:MAG TPA: BON domain-containing protein [Steroidobacteraceae bacterium]|jgi:osmotically-inducible protein OsmY|nr:BON domain-containing protein [Steroidobacteraceae bacterium]